MATLTATRTNLARHVDALVSFAEGVGRPPASVASGEYEPIIGALERYLLNTTLAVKAEASRQRVMGPD